MTPRSIREWSLLAALLVTLPVVLPATQAQAQADSTLDESAITSRELAFETSEVTGASVELSPDDRTIYFTLLGDIYSAPLGGGAATAVTQGVAYDAHPHVSPDGRWLVAQSDLPSDGLHLIPLAGGERRQLNLALEAIGPARWTVDGKALLFAARGPGEPPSVRAVYRLEIAADGATPTAPQRLTSPEIYADTPFAAGASPTDTDSWGYAAWRRATNETSVQLVEGGAARDLVTLPARRRVVGGGARGPIVVAGPDRDKLVLVDPSRSAAPTTSPVTISNLHRDAGSSVAWTSRGQLVLGNGRGIEVGDVTANWRGSPISINASVRLLRAEAPAPHYEAPSPRVTFAPRGLAAVALARPQGKVTALASVGDLTLTALQTTKHNPISAHPRWEDRPTWALNERHLAYQRFDGVRWETFVRNAVEDGTQIVGLRMDEERPVPDPGAPVTLYGWDPEGERLLVTAEDARGHTISLLTPQTGGLDALWRQEDPVDPRPFFGEQDLALYFTALDAHGVPNLHKLTSEGGRQVATPVTRFARGAWGGLLSPNGETVVFRRNRSLYACSISGPSGPSEDGVTLLTDDCDGPYSWFPNSLSICLAVGGSFVAVRVEDGEVLEFPLERRYGLPPKGDNSVIEHVSIIDVESGDVLSDRTIVVENGRIREILDAESAAAAAARFPRGPRVDGRGLFAVPGLFDLDTRMGDVDPRSLLAAGITSVRDLGGAYASSFAMKDAVDAMFIPGPRLFLSGPLLDGPTDFFGEPSPPRRGAARERMSLDQPEETRLRVEQAWQRDLHEVDLGVDLPRSLRVEASSRAGMRGLGLGADAHQLEALVASIADGAWLLQGSPSCPIGRDVLALVAASGAAWSPGADIDRIDAEAARELSTRLVLGSGAGAPGPLLGPSLIQRMLEWREAGHSELATLRAGTLGAASALGLQAEFGAVKTGNVADLVLLAANPLEGLEAFERVQWVVREGRPYSRLDLMDPPGNRPSSAPK